jgi:class 3 adenylate cyclase/tetratricopeptide (TPR) repeat protein
VCASCARPNDADALFCNGCGQPLTGDVTPPRAAGERAPRDYTPKHLADKILQRKSALEGERKQVTVLFADVKGSMELAEAVDPEEWHRILERFFQILTDGVHRFEGTVNQYTGDGIMALFGAPIAHEDHAQRACYAALHLRDVLRRYAHELKRERGLSLSVRMGLNSGEVVVGRIGDDLRMDYTAQGHTVGLAARMQELASPDTAYLAGDTAALVSGYFELEDLGPFNLRGVQEPVPVFQLHGAGALRTRFDLSRSRGLTRFVGREDDMQTISAALARAREGNGQLVGVVGEAGVGKSRLCFEFLERCRAQGLMVLEGQAVAHGRNIPFLPILQVFRAYYGITERDDGRSAREKIAGRLLLLDEGLRGVLPLVFDLLGVADPERPALQMDVDARQRQLFGVLRRLIQIGNDGNVIVTLLEDLHWIDGGSEAFLEQWVEALAGAPHLLLANFRPEYRADWTRKSYYQQLALLPLGPAAIRELLHDLLGTDPSLAELAEAIHRRTAGNPFFAEEVVYSLIEAGNLQGSAGSYRLVTPVEKLEVPASVQPLLAARVDRLPEREKRVLQAAAVIGRTFSERVLERVAELPGRDLAASLGALQTAEFIYPESLYPEAEYSFRHPLTQEVAYRSQLSERRARAHAAVARALQAIHAEKLDERAALLAHHWEAAGDPLEAARWELRSGEWVSRNNPDAAIVHWRRVRELLTRSPESRETLALGATACARILTQGWRAGLTDEEAERLFEEGKDLATRCEDLRLLALIHFGYGAAHGFAGGVRTYARHTAEALRLAEEAGDSDLQFMLQVALAYTRYLLGQFREALTVTQQALEQPPQLGGSGVAVVGIHPYAFFLLFNGILPVTMGRLDEARLALDRATEFAREQDDTVSLVVALANNVSVARFGGSAEREALAHARQGVDTAERKGGSFSRVLALRELGIAHLLNRERSDAMAALERALELAHEHRTGLQLEASVLAHLSSAQLGLGQTRRARETAERAISIAREQGTKEQECEAQLALARVLLQTEGAGARGAIEEALARALALIEETEARSYAPFVHEERAELARLLGDQAERERELREAHRLYTEMGATGHAERLAREPDR